jgi:hypothetical protein
VQGYANLVHLIEGQKTMSPKYIVVMPIQNLAGGLFGIQMQNIPDGCEASSQMYSQGTGKSAQQAVTKVIILLFALVCSSNMWCKTIPIP